MRRLAWILLSLWLGSSMGWAEQIVLRSGKNIQGTILWQDSAVVVIKTTEGLRYQYPTSDVDHIDTTVSAAISQDSVFVPQTNIKKVALVWDIAGGCAILPGQAVGGMTAVHLTIGSHRIGTKRMVMGGSIGYHGYWLGGKQLSFLPLQLVTIIPLVDRPNAPAFTMRVGYGFGVKSGTKSGITAGTDVSWWHAIDDQVALLMGLSAGWQQTQWTFADKVDGVAYTHTQGANMVSVALKVSLQF